MKRILVSLLLLAACFAVSAHNISKPAAYRLSHGIDAQVGVAVGLWGNPIPVDYDGDGLNDLLLSCPDTPYKGIYFFRNI